MSIKHPSNEKKKPASFLKKNVADILVASHIHEPYILSFRYTGENVAAEALGTLVGFFEIDIHDQDAAYIVNFLASVAKKEYFANVRRDPIESFEAALHKINVALSELVKHGNVTWLGNLNGAIALLVKNHIHFSVTGDASIGLMRDGAFRSISEGLAEQGEEPHPLKTFVEIAGGDLFQDDKIFLLSSSVWSLFTPADIERSAKRFTKEAFEQFLRTALVNELDSAALLLITCEEEKLEEPRAEIITAPPEEISPKNVFSENTFRKAEKPRVKKEKIDIPVLKESEFIDSKTGHIYVQGESIEEKEVSPWKDRFAMFLERAGIAWRHFIQKSRRSSRKWRKEAVLKSVSLGTHSGDLLRSGIRKIRSYQRRKRGDLAVRETIAPLPTSFPEEPDDEEQTMEMPSRLSETPVEEIVSETSPTPTQKIQLFSSNLFQTSTEASKKFFSQFVGLVRRGYSWIMETWKTFPARTKLYVAGGFFLLILLVGGSWYFSQSQKTASEETKPSITSLPSTPKDTLPPAPSPSPQKEDIPSLKDEQTVLEIPANETTVALLFLQDVPWAVSTKTLVNLSSGEKIESPENMRLAITMNDINSLFLLSESGKLFAFTPSNKKFTENTLPLPAGTKVTNLGAYLTYLYVFDSSQGKIYRFARTEGGFSAPISWLKESRTFSESTKLSVSDIIVLNLGNTIETLSKGKSTGQNFEKPEGGVAFSDIAILPQSNEIYALDTTQKRLIKWESSGKLVAQFSLDGLKEKAHLAVSPDQKAVFVESGKKVLRFAIP